MGSAEAPAFEAAQIVWEQGELEARGAVKVSWEGRTLTAAYARWDGETLTLREGSFDGPEGTIQFDEATLRGLDVGAQQIVLVGADGTVGGVRLQAEHLSGAGDDWRASDAAVDLCAATPGCDTASLSFTAADLEIRGGTLLLVRGGWARLFGLPVVPLPYARVNLDPDPFRLLFPEVGYGEPGWSARLHGRFGVAGRTVELGPAWRQDRGARGELEVVGPAGRLAAEAGWDTETGSARGLILAKGGVAEPEARAGWDLVVTDPDYAEDFGVRYVSRGLAWQDRRVVGAYGPARVFVDSPDDRSGGVVELRVGPRWELGPLDLQPRIEVGATGDPGSLDGVNPRLAVGDVLRFDQQLGPTRVVAVGDVEGALSAGSAGVGPVSGGALGELRIDVPMWADLPRGPWILYPGVVAGGYGVLGTLDEPAGRALGSTRLWAAEEHADGPLGRRSGEELRAGPTLGTQLGHTVRLRGEGTLAWSLTDSTVEESPRFFPSARLGVEGTLAGDTRWAGATPGLWARAGRGLQEAGLRWDDELDVSWGLGRATPSSGEVWSWTHADVGVSPGRVVVGAGADWDLGAARWTRIDARFGYDDGCLSAVLVGELSPDRTLPQLGLKLGWER